MALSVPPKTDTPTVTCTIDGVEVTVPSGTTIYTAAQQAGIDIPVLCHDERYDPVGVCRMCVVDVGGRVLAAACVRPCEDDMEVTTGGAKVEKQRAVLTELLMADQPDEDPKETTTGDNLLLELARRFETGHAERLPQARGRGIDDSNPVISVNHDACILCDRCVRACDDIQGNDVIGRTGKGYTTRIAFDLDDPMGESTCVTCGECVAACPTGALVNKPIRGVPIRPRAELKAVDTVCPYCGVGCALTYHVDTERGAISFADGREQPGNQRRLCVKGRYGWDYAASTPAPDDAADPRQLPEGPAVGRRQGRGARAQAARRARRLRRGAAALPRGDLGGGARPRGVPAQGDPRPRRRGRDRRLRLGQVLQRGGLPLPEADPRGLRHEQRRPLHAPVPRLERRRAAGGRRLRRGLDDLRRHHQRRRRDPRGHEHDGQPPRRVLVLQAGAPARHEADRRRPASRARRRARRHLLPAQAGHRRRVLQRRDARGHPARPRRPRVHPRPGDELRRARQAREGLPAGARGADLRHRRRDDPRGGAAVGRGRSGRHLLGHGDLPAHDGDRQLALPDRDVRDHRPRRQARHRPASAARPEQRAGRLGRGPDPDDVPRLPARRQRGRAREVRGRVGP